MAPHRAFAVGIGAAVLLFAPDEGCKSEDTTCSVFDGSNNDQSCTIESECVVVGDPRFCCGGQAINVSELVGPDLSAGARRMNKTDARFDARIGQVARTTATPRSGHARPCAKSRPRGVSEAGTAAILAGSTRNARRGRRSSACRRCRRARRSRKAAGRMAAPCRRPRPRRDRSRARCSS